MHDSLFFPTAEYHKSSQSFLFNYICHKSPYFTAAMTYTLLLHLMINKVIITSSNILSKRPGQALDISVPLVEVFLKQCRSHHVLPAGPGATHCLMYTVEIN